jgi:predicted permease
VRNFLLDVRYSLRALRKSPAFTVVALLSLMLGIGANVVVFGVMNAMLLRPLDVSDPQTLYQLRHKQWMIGRLLTTSYPAFEDFRQRNVTFSGMAAVYGYSHAALRWLNAATDVSGDEVSGNYFDLLGVRAELGRFFHGADERGPDSAPYVVLSDGLWRSAFQADPGVVGTTVELNEHPFTVLGVTPPQFHGMERFVWPDYWIPIVNQRQVDGRDYLQSRKSVAVTVIGRLKPGVTPQFATENLNAIAVAIAKEYPETDDGEPLRLIHPGLFGDEGDVIRGFIYGVTLLAMLVLTAACANLASLFAARVADRGGELALRVALGASRRQLLRQLLTEALLLSLLAGAAGLATADALLRVLSHWQPAAEAHLAASVDARVFLAGALLALGSALLFGMIPAWRAWHSAPLQMMKSGPASVRRLRRLAVRDLLLGTQVAVCTLLVVASLVAVRGMQRALHAPLGFQPQGAMLASLDLKRIGWTNDVAIEKEKAMIEAVRSMPGVTAAGTVNRTPFTGGLHDIPIFRPGVIEFQLKNSALAAYVYQMSPGYLNAAGTRLLRGRDVSWHDTAKTPHVAVVNETFARKMWGEAPAIGQRFVVLGDLTEVVGVAEDGKYHDLEESPHPVAYLSLSQSEQGETIFVVRSRRSVSQMAADLEHTLSSIEPNVSIAVQSWTDAFESELLPARAATAALGVMGLLAAMLAVTGIFGMAAYNVSRRMKELGIRLALGARIGQVITAALARPMALLGAGSLVGLMAGFSASRLLGQIVYQADASDPSVVVGTVLTMALLGLAAAAIPARRALAADPSKLLREE